MRTRPPLPRGARVLRLAFFSAYWTAIVGLVVSLAFAVIGRQMTFWSAPADTPREESVARCEQHVRTLMAELDASVDSALATAARSPGRALPAFRRFAGRWEGRWRRVRYGCGLDQPGKDTRRTALASAHDLLLDQRYALESLVRRYADGEGATRSRIEAALARASGGTR